MAARSQDVKSELEAVKKEKNEARSDFEEQMKVGSAVGYVDCGGLLVWRRECPTYGMVLVTEKECLSFSVDSLVACSIVILLPRLEQILSRDDKRTFCDFSRLHDVQ